MKECNNSKIHISSNFTLSISFLIMFDILLLRPSLHCNTLLHFTTLRPTTLHYTYRHFDFSHLHFTTLSFTFPIVLFHLTSLNWIQYNSHFQTYFQNNEPLHCPKELLTISLRLTSLHFLFYFIFIFIIFSYSINPSLHFILFCYSYLQLTSLHFLLFIAFISPHWFSLS
jgi:hypothetical protein